MLPCQISIPSTSTYWYTPAIRRYDPRGIISPMESGKRNHIRVQPILNRIGMKDLLIYSIY